MGGAADTALLDRLAAATTEAFHKAGQVAPAVRVSVDAAALVIRLATGPAYTGRPAPRIVAGLRSALALSDDLIERFETALHEAIANAVVHGNLELAEPDGLDGHAAQEALITRLLQDETLAARTVTITIRWTDAELEVAVQDQGRGYALFADDGARHGRGLYIIRAFSDRALVGDGGRRITLGFRR